MELHLAVRALHPLDTKAGADPSLVGDNSSEGSHPPCETIPGRGVEGPTGIADALPEVVQVLHGGLRRLLAAG